MKKESLGKARAISTSLAIILFMGLFCLMPAAGAKADQDLVPVTTATELKEAFAEARDGTTIRLQEDIFYDRYELGSIEVNRKVILDFAGYKLTTSNAPQNKNNIYALFGTIEPGASLTLIDAQLETDNRMGVVDTN
ncbi:MAG: hypothetical protein GX809_04700, partial [Clostridiaceae bacterium]|nr:hypothetical protein [Clostridiaceae bacterium]